jgi:hypothetical protein
MPAARADVVIDNPERWAKQLVAHLGHRLETATEPAGDRLVFDTGSCLVSPRGDRLLLVARADDDAGLQRIQEVVGGHLERFAQKLELSVRWQPDDGG